MGATVRLLVAPELRAFLPPRSRNDGGVDVPLDPGTPLAHLVPAAGVPLTEVGDLRVVDDDAAVTPAHRPSPGAVVEVAAVRRPQRGVSTGFVLDVHLGALARRMRLLGLDVAYANDAGDAELVARALGETRVLLTQDHALLRRRVLAPVPAADGGASLARAAHVRERGRGPARRRPGPVRAPARAVHALRRLRRRARPRERGRGGAPARARHAAHLPGVRPVRRVRAAVLARRARTAARRPRAAGAAPARLRGGASAQVRAPLRWPERFTSGSIGTRQHRT
jgi:hypothetical protein